MNWKLGGSDGSSSRPRYCSEQGGRDSFSRRDHDDDEDEGRRGRGDGHKDMSWHRGWLSRSKSSRHEPYRRKDSRRKHAAYDDMEVGAKCTGSGPLRRRYNGKKRAATTSPTKKVLIVQETSSAAEGSEELAHESEVQVADDGCTLQEFLDSIAQTRPLHLLPTPTKSATSKRQLQQNIVNDPDQQNKQENSIVRRSARLAKNPKGAGALELKAQEFLARGLGIISDGEGFDAAAKSLFVKMFQGPEPLTEAAILAIDKLVVLIKKKMQKKKGKGKGKANETLLLGAAPVVDV